MLLGNKSTVQPIESYLNSLKLVLRAIQSIYFFKSKSLSLNNLPQFKFCCKIHE